MRVEDRETLNWLKEIGSRGFEPRPWYLESKNHNQHGRDNHIHTRPGCTKIHAFSVIEKIVTALLDETSNTGHRELDGSNPTGLLCIECGYGFLHSRSSVNMRQQAQRLHQTAKHLSQLEHPAIDAEMHVLRRNALLLKLPGMLEPHLITEQTPALQGLLTHHYIDRLQAELQANPINKSLQFAETAIVQTMERLRAEFPLDIKAARHDAMLLGAKHLIQQIISTHMFDPEKKPHIDWKKMSDTHKRAVGQLQNKWLDSIVDLDDAMTPDTAIRRSDEYRHLLETLPLIDEIVTFWKQTFQRTAKRRETTFFTTDSGVGLVRQPPATARAAIVTHGIRIVDEQGRRFGEMPLLAAHWVRAAPYEWYVPVIKIVHYKHRQLDGDHWEMLKALWKEAKNDPASLYREPVHLFRAAGLL